MAMIAPYPGGAPATSHRPADGTLPWLVGAVALLAGGLIAFLVDPRLGLVVAAVPLAPLLVLRPEYGLYLLFAVVPFDAVAALSEDEGASTLTRLLGIAVLGAWVIHLLGNRRSVRLGTAGTVLMAYVVFAATSIAWSVDTSVTKTALRTLVQLATLYVMVANVLRTPQQMRRALDVLLVATTVLAVFVLVQAPGGAIRARLTYGTHEMNPNYVAAALALPAAAALGLGRDRGPLGWWRFAAVVPICIALFITGSRGGGIALASGLLAIALVRPGRGIWGAVAALAVVLLLPAVLPQQTVDAMWERYSHAEQDRFSGRFDIWRVGLAMVADRPLEGTGIGGFPVAFYQYMTETPVDFQFARENSRGNRAAHNVYLGTLAELGVIGSALLVVGLAAHGLAARRAQRRAAAGRDRDAARLGVALVGVFAAMLVMGGSIDLLGTKLPWMLLGLMAATALPGTAFAGGRRS